MQDAYQTWHCGNEDGDCHGTELEERHGRMQCPNCERKYLSDGTLDTDED